MKQYTNEKYKVPFFNLYIAGRSRCVLQDRLLITLRLMGLSMLENHSMYAEFGMGVIY